MKKKIITTLILVLGLTTGILYLVLHYNYFSGVRAGKLVKLSKKGFIYKTYEGTLDLGSGDKLTWDFSVRSDKVGEELSKYHGRKVKLEYNELLFKVFHNTKYDVVSFNLEEDDTQLNHMFCQLVGVLRQDAIVVERLRAILAKENPVLLAKIRECQAR